MGGSVGEEEVVVGEPTEEILEMARRVHVDAIVMGRRGLGDLGGLVFGSVSHKVGQLTERTLITTE
jgi:nucleotide-binding universal stress UspA family protein